MKFALHYMGGKNGTERKHLEVTEEMYRKANAAEMTVRDYLRNMADDAGGYNPDLGDPLDQMIQASGLVGDRNRGIRNMTLKDLSESKISAGTGFRDPDGTDDSLGARLLFPQMLLETMQMNLRDDGSDIIAKYNELVALTRNLNGQRVEQPLIDVSKPEGSRSGRIAQMSEPETMVSIDVGQKAYSIPTKSIGLTVSDQAMAATTIDLVRIVMEAQARGERIAMIEEQLHAMVMGDPDRDMEALPQQKASQYDSAITENGQISKRAYIKWLRENYRVREISHVLTNLDTILDIDERLSTQYQGVVGADPSKVRTPFMGFNLDIQDPKFLDFNESLFGANTLVGLDSRNAIQRFINISAEYSAIENYVMRRATSFRVDHGEMAVRLHDEAWSVLSLTT